MQQWETHNWEKFNELVYKCRLSALYHRKRERFFSLLEKMSTSCALVAGSAAFSEILSSPESKSMAGAAVAAATLPSVVFAWSDKARLHSVLASRFTQVEAELEGAGVLNAIALDSYKSRLLSLEAEEPPSLSALTRKCQNELAFAIGDQSSVTNLKFHERMFCHLLDFPVA